VFTRQQLENTLENSTLRPSTEALMHDLPIAKALREIPPAPLPIFYRSCASAERPAHLGKPVRFPGLVFGFGGSLLLSRVTASSIFCL
jgi:hypothetical protein